MTKQEAMFKLVSEQAAGSQTITAFCAGKDIKMKTFLYWKRKYCEAQTAGVGFIDVAAFGQLSDQPINIIYPNGVNIQLVTADLPLIAQLIRIA